MTRKTYPPRKTPLRAKQTVQPANTPVVDLYKNAYNNMVDRTLPGYATPHSVPVKEDSCSTALMSGLHTMGYTILPESREWVVKAVKSVFEGKLKKHTIFVTMSKVGIQFHTEASYEYVLAPNFNRLNAELNSEPIQDLGPVRWEENVAGRFMFNSQKPNSAAVADALAQIEQIINGDHSVEPIQS